MTLGPKTAPAPAQYAPLPAFAATFLVAATGFLLSFPAIFSTLAIVVMYAIWLPKVVRRGRFAFSPGNSYRAAFVLPVLALLSTGWSDDRLSSLRAGLEFVSMVVCVVICSKATRPADFIRGTWLAGVAAAVIGAVASDMFGIFRIVGSKNQLGFVACVAVIFALLVTLSKRDRGIVRLFAFLSVGPGLAVLYVSQSAGAMVALAAALGAMGFIFFARGLPRSARLQAAAIFLVLGTGVVGTIGMLAGGEEALLRLTGKDTTLTGRTTLWESAVEAGLEAPILGHGYNAFWVPGRPMAERFWYEFDISARTGFHFHDAYLEAFVELGAVGAFCLTVILLAGVVKSIGIALMNEDAQFGQLCIAIFVFSTIRGIVEVDCLGPFGLATFVLFSAIFRAANVRRLQGSPDAEPAPRRRRRNWRDRQSGISGEESLV